MYQTKLHNRLEEAGAFGVETRDKREVLEEIRAFNEGLHLPHHARLPYLYGSWKAKKQAFRWIAGTSRVQDVREESAVEEDGPPKNALSELGEVMTKVLQRVTQTLRTKDIEGRSRGLPARFWVIEDIDEFVQEFRTLASDLA